MPNETDNQLALNKKRAPCSAPFSGIVTLFNSPDAAGRPEFRYVLILLFQGRFSRALCRAAYAWRLLTRRCCGGLPFAGATCHAVDQ